MRTKLLLPLFLASALLPACSSRPTAASVCAKIVAAGIGSNCAATAPAVINARAKEKVDFDLVSVQGKKGAVMSFADKADFDATVEAYKAAAMLAGPHRYGSEKALIFVQMNDGASLDVGQKAKAIVDGL